MSWVKEHKTGFAIVVLSILLVLLFFVDLCFGSVNVPLAELKKAIDGTSPLYSSILFDIRLPKAVLSVLVGVALSVSGLLMQTYFRNPLVGPYVLGISSGATLGVAIFVMLFSLMGITLSDYLMRWGSVIFAMIGALLLFIVIIMASFRVRDTVTLLIVGVMMGTIATALISVLQHLSDPDSVKLFINWTLGSLSTAGWKQIGVIVPVMVVGMLIVVYLMKPLDALLLGEEYASSLGVSVSTCRFLIILTTVLLTGVTTAFTGPIGFVGIAVPHITRALLNTSIHRKVVPCSMLIGSCMMLLCDIISQLPQNGYVLPINAVTALMGVPVVFWVILGNKRFY